MRWTGRKFLEQVQVNVISVRFVLRGVRGEYLLRPAIFPGSPGSPCLIECEVRMRARSWSSSRSTLTDTDTINYLLCHKPKHSLRICVEAVDGLHNPCISGRLTLDSQHPPSNLIIHSLGNKRHVGKGRGEQDIGMHPVRSKREVNPASEYTMV